MDADKRKGDLNKRFDVIVLPDNAPGAITTGRLGREEGDSPQPPPEVRGGLGEAGLASLRSFAEAGGTIVALNRASQVYTAKDAPVSDVLEGVAAKDFYIPGSILEVAVDTSNPLALGSRPTVPIFFEQSPAFRVSGTARSAANYTSSKPLLSGWILGGAVPPRQLCACRGTRGKRTSDPLRIQTSVPRSIRRHIPLLLQRPAVQLIHDSQSPGGR
ncbi:MAG: hypothetical protein ACRYGF_16220 [Janthinobacterium lividum]